MGALPLQLLSNGVVRISFVLPANRALQGPTHVAQLCFTSSPTQHSAFVPLRITEVEGRTPSGSIVANAYGLPGWWGRNRCWRRTGLLSAVTCSRSTASLDANYLI